MTYTTASGVVIPQGTDAFNPPAQFKTWADKAATYDYFISVQLDSERTSLSAPTLRDGLHCFVRATNTLWRYLSGTWANAGTQDTGWINATMAGTWGSDSAQTVKYRRINGIVYMQGRPIGGAAGVAFTLPAGFRPGADLIAGPNNGAATTSARVVISASAGTVTLLAGTTPNLADIAPFPADQ